MLKHSVTTTVRAKAERPAGPRRLQVEPLESRTLLSAVSPAPVGPETGFVADPWRPSPFDRQPSAEYAPAVSAADQLSASLVDNADPPSFPGPFLRPTGERSRSLGLANGSFAALGDSMFTPAAGPSSLVNNGAGLFPDGTASTTTEATTPGSPEFVAPLSPALFRGLGALAAYDRGGQDRAFPVGELDGATRSLPGQDSKLGDAGMESKAPLALSITGNLDELAPRRSSPPGVGMLAMLNDPFDDMARSHPWQEAGAPPDTIGSLMIGGGQFETPRNEPPSVLMRQSVRDDGGLIQLATYSLLGLMDSSSAYSTWTGAARHSQTAAGDVSDLAADAIFQGIASRSEPTGGIDASAADEWSEGGLIDVGQVSPAFSDEESGPLPSWLRSPLSHSVEEDVVDLLWGRVDNLVAEPGEAEGTEQNEQPLDEASPGDENSEKSEPNPSVASDSSEGGMIELAAVSSTANGCCQTADTSGPAAKAVPNSAENIRVDRSLGLYRAFELATSLSEPVAAPESAWNGQHAASAESGSNLTSAAADTPAAETSAAAQAAPSDQHHAAATPAILIVSLASRIAGTSKQRERLTENTHGAPQSESRL